MPRSAASYETAVKSFNVASNPDYLPSNGNTYCNYFAQAVMNHQAIMAPLPTGLCSTMLNSLWGNSFPKWYSVGTSDAQARANQGYPTIAITSDHVAVVIPNGGISVTRSEDVLLAQAGASCFYGQTLNWAWTPAAIPGVRFYSWYD